MEEFKLPEGRLEELEKGRKEFFRKKDPTSYISKINSELTDITNSLRLNKTIQRDAEISSVEYARLNSEIEELEARRAFLFEERARFLGKE